MKVGNLVKCLFQPSSRAVQDGICLPMLYNVKGELGIYTAHRDNSSGTVLFPRLGYEHVLAWSALEVINEI